MSLTLTVAGGGGTGSIYLEVAAGVTAAVLAGRYAEARSKRKAGAARPGAKDVAVLRGGAELRIPVSRLVVGEVFVVSNSLRLRHFR